MGIAFESEKSVKHLAAPRGIGLVQCTEGLHWIKGNTGGWGDVTVGRVLGTQV